MSNRTEHNLTWRHKFCAALGSALGAMLVACIIVLVQDLRVRAILGVGITVFLIVLLVVSVSGYRRMAARILGALIISCSWGAKAFAAGAPLTDDIFVQVAIETTSWIEPVSLTICFVLLIVFDIATNYVFPYLYEKLSCLRKTGESDTPMKFQITTDDDSVKAKYEGPPDKTCLNGFKRILESPIFRPSHRVAQKDRNNKG